MMQPKDYKQLPQVPIYQNDLAAFLILKGHLIDSQKVNFKKPLEWIYWFRKDENIYDHMNDYGQFKSEMCLIRDKAKNIDKIRKTEYNRSIKGVL